MNMNLPGKNAGTFNFSNVRFNEEHLSEVEIMLGGKEWKTSRKSKENEKEVQI